MRLKDTLQGALTEEKKTRQKNSFHFWINNPSKKNLVQGEREKQYFSSDLKEELQQGEGM